MLFAGHGASLACPRLRVLEVIVARREVGGPWVVIRALTFRDPIVIRLRRSEVGVRDRRGAGAARLVKTPSNSPASAVAVSGRIMEVMVFIVSCLLVSLLENVAYGVVRSRMIPSR